MGKTEKIRKALKRCMDNEGKKGRRIEAHSVRVASLCDDFADTFALKLCDASLDRKLLCRAALVHDIAKIEYEDEHHDAEHIKSVVRQYLSAEDINDKKLDRIVKVASHHAGKHFSPNDHALESAILRISDKLDKFVKHPDEWNKNLKSCEKNMKKIEASNTLNDQELAVLRKHYKKVLRERLPCSIYLSL